MTVVAVVEVLATITGALLLIPALVFFIETSLADPRAMAASTEAPLPRRPSVAILVPAHDEAVNIAATLAVLRSEMQPGDRLLVVADNCTDDTAAIAEAAGGEVARRHDQKRRGKGYALDFGVRHLAVDPPEVVVIVDADCTLHPGSLDRLALACVATRRPAQAVDLAMAPTGAALPTRIAEFAWAVKNLARPLGLLRLGLPCQLMGTGMAFPWLLIEHAPLASGHIVEDMRLGLDLTAAGTPPLFCPEARVTSFFATSETGLAAQRTRWEHGHLGVIVERGLPLLWQAIRSGNLALLAVVLDLCVPPLASLVLALSAGIVIGAVGLALGTGGWPLALCALGLALVAVGVVVSWRRFGRSIVTARELVGVPAYVLAKLPMYWRALVSSEARWLRADRDDGAPK